MRIYIIGGNGSGKTYLATAIAKEYTIPYFSLDTIKFGSERKWKEKDAFSDEQKLKSSQYVVANNDSWVAEGAYTRNWVKPFCDQSEILIVLCPPLFKRVFLILLRYATNLVYSPKTMLPSLSFMYLFHTIRNTCRFKLTFPEKDYGDKICYFDTNKDALKYIQSKYAK